MKIKLCLRTLFLLSISLTWVMSSLTSGVGFLPTTLDLEEKFWTDSRDNLENFAIVVLSDTQTYSEKYPWIFENQTQWITENIEQLNIVFVSHLGDLVEHWDSIMEWENADRGMSRLIGNVPWGVLPGNHDGPYENLTNYNKYFGYDRFRDESWYGGAYQNNNTNSYQLFSAGGNNYLILHLQYVPSDDVYSWASVIIDNYPNRRVIVSTHQYLAGHGGDDRSPHGEEMWERLVKPNADQIFLVLCGDLPGEERRTDMVDGNAVHQLLSNYQLREDGGNGWLRILEFFPSQDKILVKTFSPHLNKFETDSNSQFTLDISRTDFDDELSPFTIVLIFMLIGAIIAVIASYLILTNQF